VLTAGVYVVGAFYVSQSLGPDPFIAMNDIFPGTVSTLPGVTFDESRIAIGSSLVFPSRNGGFPGGFFGPNLFTVAAPPVPEPKTYAMLMAGLVLLGFIARRRRKSLNAAA
jgi:hypothetical protein